MPSRENLNNRKIKKYFKLEGFSQSVMRVNNEKGDRTIVSLNKKDKRIPVLFSVPEKIEEWKQIATRNLQDVKIDTEVAGHVLITIPNNQKNRKHF